MESDVASHSFPIDISFKSYMDSLKQVPEDFTQGSTRRLQMETVVQEVESNTTADVNLDYPRDYLLYDLDSHETLAFEDGTEDLANWFQFNRS